MGTRLVFSIFHDLCYPYIPFISLYYVTTVIILFFRYEVTPTDVRRMLAARADKRQIILETS